VSNLSKSSRSSLRSRICVSLAEPTVARMAAALRVLELAEVRLDALRDPSEDLAPLFAGKRRVIATCRPGPLADRARLSVLGRALDAGARMVDVELEMPSRLRDALVAEAHRRKALVIISTHNFEETPSQTALRAYAVTCFHADADIAKIACKVNRPEDNANLLGLVAEWAPLIAVGMGKLGLPTRLVAPLLGAEFTYASRAGSRPTAPGQLTFEETLARMQVLQRQLF
jgi:3-dehydroquinate dehydratase I